MEVDVSKGRRDWAFSERDKVGKFWFYPKCASVFAHNKLSQKIGIGQHFSMGTSI